jgi:hypothetical protein
MHCSEFHEWLIHLNRTHDEFYGPYTSVPDPQNFSNFLKMWDLLRPWVVSHYTDTHLYVFSLPLALPVVINTIRRFPQSNLEYFRHRSFSSQVVLLTGSVQSGSVSTEIERDRLEEEEKKEDEKNERRVIKRPHSRSLSKCELSKCAGWSPCEGWSQCVYSQCTLKPCVSMKRRQILRDLFHIIISLTQVTVVPTLSHVPHSRMDTGPWVFFTRVVFRNQTFALVSEDSVRPIDYSVSDNRVVFAPSPTQYSCSSLSHAHMSMGFFHRQTLALVAADSDRTRLFSSTYFFRPLFISSSCPYLTEIERDRSFWITH